jgi:hypothetical protein
VTKATVSSHHITFPGPLISSKNADFNPPRAFKSKQLFKTALSHYQERLFIKNFYSFMIMTTKQHSVAVIKFHAIFLLSDIPVKA